MSYNVEITKEIKIGDKGLVKITKETYGIPSRIICEIDGTLMNYDAYHGAYICMCSGCRNWINGVDFVKEELAKAGIETSDEQD